MIRSTKSILKSSIIDPQISRCIGRPRLAGELAEFQSSVIDDVSISCYIRSSRRFGSSANHWDIGWIIDRPAFPLLRHTT